ncbi:hypothetical protein ACERII_21470 [Evansella sp. AB-rgal1]|uniref:hypothetical protein n=1 Tax=Evansella sp. AB-rgal1 TaxID=3242696 RepID=UPI00359CCA3F
MGPLDDRLKELRVLERDDDAKMRSFHQAKAKLYEPETKKDTSFGKLLGVPIALLSAVFIGFLLSYQWFGDNLGGPAIDEERTEPFVTSSIDHIYIGFGDSVDEFGLHDVNNPELDYVMIDDPEFLERFENDLNAPRTVVKRDFIPMLEVELVLENGEEVPLFFSISRESGVVETHVYQFDNGMMFQYKGDMVTELREFLMAEVDEKEEKSVTETIYYSLEAALQEFPYDIVTPGESPLGLLVDRVTIYAHGKDAFALHILYKETSNGDDKLIFGANISDENHSALPYDGQDLLDRNGRQFSFHNFGETADLNWEDNNFKYMLASVLAEGVDVGLEELLHLTDEMYGISIDNNHEEEQFKDSPLEKYAVFTEYDLGSYNDRIAEASAFYMGDDENYVLGFGHQAHAVIRYLLYEVDEETNEVRVIRRIVDSYQDQTEEFVEAEDWDGLIDFLLEYGQELDQLYFKYSGDVAEEEIELDGTIHNLYPVEVGENIHYFKEGKGLWMKVYNDEMTIVRDGGEHKEAIRITD